MKEDVYIKEYTYKYKRKGRIRVGVSESPKNDSPKKVPCLHNIKSNDTFPHLTLCIPSLLLFPQHNKVMSLTLLSSGLK